MNKTLLYKTGVILFALLSVFSIVLAIPSLLGGPETESVIHGIPQVIVLAGALSGVAGLVAAYGAWKDQKWGIWLAIILCALNGLSALPGITEAPTNILRILAIATVALCIFIIVALLRQPILTASQSPNH